MKKKHSAILRKREAEVATRLSPSWNGQARKTVLSSDGISYDGQWGYAPLIVTLAQRGEVLYAVNRSGNRPSHEGAPEWLDRSIERVRAAAFRTVRLRGDTDFSLTAHFDRWTEAGVEFDFGIDANPSFVKRADGFPEGSWKELARPRKGQGRRRRQRRAKVKPEIVQARGFKKLTLEREEIAEMDYRPSKAEGTYLLLVLRKTLRPYSFRAHRAVSFWDGAVARLRRPLPIP